MESNTDCSNNFLTIQQYKELMNYTEDSKTKKLKSCPLVDKLRQGKISRTSLVKISIFDNPSPQTNIKKDKETINNILDNLPNLPESLTRQEIGGIGSMLGMAIGDSMGHRFEFEPVKYNKIELKNMGEGPGGAFGLLPGQWTDDTSMGLCLADSLLVQKGQFHPHDLMLRFLSWWIGGYDNAFRNNPRESCGLGGNISCSFRRYFEEFEPYTKAGDKNTSGNGSLMGNAAVPICFWNNINLACDIARKQSYVTHQGTEAAECCALLTYIVVNILNYVKLDLKKFLEKLVEGYSENDIKIKGFETSEESVKCLAESKQEGDDKDRNWNWREKNFKYSPSRSKANPGYIGSYAMDALSMSLHIIYHTNNFKDAIIKAVNLRGDSDSVGSIVGQIAGAYYGVGSIDKDWVKTVGQWDSNEIALRGYMLARLIPPENKLESKTK